MAKRGAKISRAIILLLDQAVEGEVDLATLPYRVSKFSHHLFRESRRYSRPQVKRALIHLIKSGLVTLSGVAEGHAKAALTEKGRAKANAWRVETLLVRKPKYWDGKWRMVIFDIPEGRRRERDAIRHKLKELGFYKLQDSIWIYPYDCRKAVSHLAESYNVKDNVHLAIVDVFDQEDEARKRFGIREHALPYEAGEKHVELDFPKG